MFYSLGFGKMDTESLQAEFIKQAQEKYASGDYVLGRLDFNEQRIDIEIIIERDGTRSASIVFLTLV